MKLRLLILPVIALLLQSCGGNVGVSTFIKAADAADGVYRFETDLSDSLSAYDISFYTRIAEPLMLEVDWISPSAVPSLKDSVWVEPAGRKAVFALYRSGVCPEEKGVWTIAVRPSAVPRGFCGLGIVAKKNGTR